jgi:hypothetical protein
MRWTSVLVVLLALAGRSAVAAADVVVRHVGVEVAATDPRGHAWDSGGGALAAPDPAIELVVDGRTVHTCDAARDTFTADCEIPAMPLARGPIAIEVRVVDRDVIADDDIGRATATIGPHQRGRIALRADGGVVSAWVDVEAVEPPLVSAPLAILLAAHVGVAIPFVLLGLWRRRFVRARARWRSPAVVVGWVAASAGLVVAVPVSGPYVEPLVASIPTALGAVAITCAVIDVVAHRRLGYACAAVAGLGTCAAAAVPASRALGGPAAAFDMLAGVALFGWMLVLFVKDPRSFL